MHLIAIKDLKQPRLLKQRLLAEKELLLTSDGTVSGSDRRPSVNRRTDATLGRFSGR